MTWNAANIRHYESLGYRYTKFRDSFQIPIEHLPLKSVTKIRVMCDNCSIVKDIPFNRIAASHTYKLTKDINLYYCVKCANEIYNKHNTDIYKQEVENLVEEEYQVIGEYINQSIKIEMKHVSCGNLYKVTPNAFLRGDRCPKCSHKALKEQYVFEKEVLEKHKGEYVVTGKYIGYSKKVEIQHVNCGEKFRAYPKHILVKINCPNCSSRIYNHEDFISAVEQQTGNEYTFLEKYIKANTKISVKHNLCGYEYKVTPSKFINGRRCPFCAKRVKDTAFFKNEIFDMYGFEYEVIGEYVAAAKPLEVIHTSCGNQYSTTPNNLLAGKGCAKCNKPRRIDTKAYIEDVKRVHSDEIVVIGDYKNSNTKIKIKHACGYEWSVYPLSILKGHGCPKCLFSRGEKNVDEFLIKNNLYCDYQVRFDDCKYRNPLPFDFGVYGDEQLTNLICLIEYDGEQHYHPTRREDGEKQLKLIQKRDKIKTDYCAANNIPLIRIPYWDFKNIDTILTKRLTELGVLSPTLVEA
ncbi:hypothetical protein [Paenibacillus illinoisensis]|uniref:hypothetical protein n=1 Tax=Paenibacillus illinoisensis TaxID=59845 RepID=UPI001C64D030|nr:hypothetical protein [Paenibacillus illinoisensis]